MAWPNEPNATTIAFLVFMSIAPCGITTLLYLLSIKRSSGNQQEWTTPISSKYS